MQHVSELLGILEKRLKTTPRAPPVVTFISLEIKIKEITSYKYIGIAAKLSRD